MRLGVQGVPIAPKNLDGRPADKQAEEIEHVVGVFDGVGVVGHLGAATELSVAKEFS